MTGKLSRHVSSTRELETPAPMGELQTTAQLPVHGKKTLHGNSSSLRGWTRTYGCQLGVFVINQFWLLTDMQPVGSPGKHKPRAPVWIAAEPESRGQLWPSDGTSEIHAKQLQETHLLVVEKCNAFHGPRRREHKSWRHSAVARSTFSKSKQQILMPMVIWFVDKKQEIQEEFL